MANYRIPITLAPASIRHDARLDGRTTARELAAYFSRLEPTIDTSTLEIARPIAPAVRLHALNWQDGDRLAVFAQPPTPRPFPLPARPGDQIVRFEANGFSTTSGGKQTLTVGKPHNSTTPDVDLRLFFKPDALSYISRQCLQLTYSPQEGIWFVQRTGNTRIQIDEIHLAQSMIPLNAAQQVHFYRASDDPTDPATQPLGSIRVSVQTIEHDQTAGAVQPGGTPVQLALGMEEKPLIIRASENLQVGQITPQLLTYWQAVDADHIAAIYHLRLLAPDTALHNISLDDEALLYIPHPQQITANVLQLTDIHDRARRYMIRVENEDKAVRLGWRADGNPAQNQYDVDLRASVVAQSVLPADAVAMLRYNADQRAWWVVPNEASGAAVFVNNTRLGSAPVMLTSGDVLSFGMTVSHYYARFEVGITRAR